MAIFFLVKNLHQVNAMKHDVKPRIVHVLDDGTRLDSIEGFVIPDGHPFYTVWRNIVLAKRKEEAADENRS